MMNEEVRSMNWDQEPLTEVMDYIVQRHHSYCRHAVAAIEPLLSELYKREGEKRPALKRINSLFAKLSTELLRHLLKEEDTLFPYIARMEVAASRREALPRPTYGTIANPVRMMMMEHDATGDDFEQIRRVTNNFECPQDATPKFKELYQTLRELDQDLLVHSELEDKVLFPRAIALEETVETSAKERTSPPR